MFRRKCKAQPLQLTRSSPGHLPIGNWEKRSLLQHAYLQTIIVKKCE
jgi:hypothetical protein